MWCIFKHVPDVPENVSSLRENIYFSPYSLWSKSQQNHKCVKLTY